MKILEEFWYGNIEPTDYDTSSCKEYKKLQELICWNEEKLRVAMTDEQKFALAMNESLPIPEQCQHQFSEEFERKMQRLLSAVPINTQIAVVVPELSYNQTYELQ